MGFQLNALIENELLAYFVSIQSAKLWLDLILQIESPTLSSRLVMVPNLLSAFPTFSLITFETAVLITSTCLGVSSSLAALPDAPKSSLRSEQEEIIPQIVSTWLPAARGTNHARRGTAPPTVRGQAGARGTNCVLLSKVR